LNADYDLESETNKTKRSKAPFRWLDRDSTVQ
jgi:hypothetical protein